MTGILTRRSLLTSAGALQVLAACAGNPSRGKNRHVIGMSAVTIGVADINRALALFGETMGLTVESRGKVSSARRKLWGLPSGTSAEMVELSCAGYPIGRVRVLHLTPPPTTFVRTDFGPEAEDSPYAVGPKALAFYAKGEVIAAADDFRKYGLQPRYNSPALYPGGNYEFTFTGVGNAPTIAVSRPKNPTPNIRPDLPTDRYSEVTRVSVISDDLRRTREFYGDVLGFGTRYDEPVTAGFARATRTIFGIPTGFDMHRVMYAADNEASGRILVLQVSDQPKQKLRHVMGPQHRGLCIYTYAITGMDNLHQRVMTAGFEVIAPPTSVDGARMMIVRGPNGEFCEMVEKV